MILLVGLSRLHILQLNEMGIDYDGPNLNEKINTDLVITLKQLLMFAVQISYGLVTVVS